MERVFLALSCSAWMPGLTAIPARWSEDPSNASQRLTRNSSGFGLRRNKPPFLERVP